MKIMKPRAYIFDIDGTIACNDHRQHWVRHKPKNWKAYNAPMALDPVIEQVADILRILFTRSEETHDHNLVICTGREEVYRKTTEQWLKKHNLNYDQLLMRHEGDFRDDTIIKEEMLKELQEKYDIIAAFDDRPKVCRMWVKNGIFVFRCQQIEEEF